MTSALVLSALVGIVMPVGDTAVASAQAATLDQATPETSAVEPVPNEPADEQKTPEDQVTDTPVTPAPSTETPESDEAAPEAPAPDRLSAAPRAQAAPFATPSGPSLTWTVAEATGPPIGGATVTVQGPATVDWRGRLEWGASYSVADCTTGPCAANSMDQDPRPGHFAVDRLVSGRTVTRLAAGSMDQRFRILPLNAPQGYGFSRSDWVEIPRAQWGNAATPSPRPWAKPAYDFGTLQLRKTEPLECVAGTFYSISNRGQLQRVAVNSANTATSVENIGLPAGSGSSMLFNGLAVGLDGESVFAYERNSMPATVYQFDTATQRWKNLGISVSTENKSVLADLQLVGGAMDPQGTYWVGGFVKRGTYTKGNFQLWALERGDDKMKLRGQLNLRALERSYIANGNGDFAFDNEGNLYVVRGVSDGKHLAIFSASPDDLKLGEDTELVKAKTVFAHKENASPFAGVNGIAYDVAGRLFVGGPNGLGYLQLPVTGERPTEIKGVSGLGSTTDLASCSFPPTVKIQKDLPDGRAFASDQFALDLHAEISGKKVLLGSAKTGGQEPGIQENAIGPIPVSFETKLSFSETPANSSTKLGNYATSWECVSDNKVLWSGKGTTAAFTMPETASGLEILCTIKNTLMEVTKEADPKSGTTVNGGDIVNYTLRFNNSKGATPAAVNYRDFLEDVLDDATFFDPATKQRSAVPSVSTSHSSLTYSWKSENEWLDVGGTVPAGEVGTVKFPVMVLSNSQDSADRQGLEETEGFFLRNKLERGTSDVPPTECVEGLCTEHPINAWTVTKDSLPADGARLHKGGNVHYKVTATKANAQTVLNGLVLSDDLTHVFKSAGWDPGAVVPGGANRAGVYLFNKDNRTVGLDGKPNSENPAYLRSVQDVPAPTERNFAAPGAPADMRWIVTSGAPINLPKEAERAEMWFAVVAAESPVGVPEASIWEGQGAAPVSGWQFVNYATGIATKQPGSQMGDFAPNECATGMNVPDTSAAPNAAEPVDLQFPEQCRVQHSMSQNFFTIRKDAAGAGVQALADDSAWDPDPTGLWNMVGHEFEIRDNDPKTTAPTSYPSVKLCRTDYSPAENWNGKWISAANAGDESRWAFGSEGAAIQQGILDWNNAHPEAKPLPVCGTIYEISSGAQKGRWRSENLESGDYWLIETKAPNAQAAVNATTKNPRPVPGVQRLAQPVPFKVWPEADGLALGGSSMQGRGQLDVGNGSGGYLDRCNPGEQDENGEFVQGGTVAERRTACVHSTGYLMLVRDPAPTPLPLTGGIGPWMLWGGGAAVLLIATAGIIWWRVRRPAAPRHGA